MFDKRFCGDFLVAAGPFFVFGESIDCVKECLKLSMGCFGVFEPGSDRCK
jgi:hypothetical protein